MPRNSLLGSALLINVEGVAGLTTRVQVRLWSMGGRGRAAQCRFWGKSASRRAQIFQRGGRRRFELWLCFPLNEKLVLNFSGGVERYLRQWSSVRRFNNVLERDVGGASCRSRTAFSPSLASPTYSSYLILLLMPVPPHIMLVCYLFSLRLFFLAHVPLPAGQTPLRSSCPATIPH